MLDYAANAVAYWSVEALRARLADRARGQGSEANEFVAAFLGLPGEPGADAALGEAGLKGGDDGGGVRAANGAARSAAVEAYWGRVRTNLQAGRVRLLFVGDRIPTELRRVVEFLNRQMQPAEVLAVELRQYEGQGLKTLVPIVIGQSQEAAARKGGGPVSVAAPRPAGPKRVWDRASLLDDLAARTQDDPGVLEVAHRLADWIERRSDTVEFGQNPDWGTMSAVFRADGGVPVQPIRLWSDGTLAVQFQYLLDRPIFGALEARQAFLDRLNAVPGVRLPASAVTKRPSVRLQALAEAGGADALLAALDWLVGQLRGAPNARS